MMRARLLGTPDLVSAGGVRIQSVLAQPKRTALLAWLLLARPRGAHAREALVELFWPGLDPERGRTALRKSLHFLRQALGGDVIGAAAGSDVRIASDAIACDVFDLERAVAAHDWRAALHAYGGDLLDGLLAHEAPGFSHWLDAERARIRALALRAAAAGADEARHAGDVDAEWFFCERGMQIDPVDDALARRVLDLGGRSGDAGRALALYDAHVARMASEYELAPPPALVAAASALRALTPPHAAALPDTAGEAPEARTHSDRAAPADDHVVVAAAAIGAGDVSSPRARRMRYTSLRRRARAATLTATAAACAAVVLLALFVQRSSATATPLLAIGLIRDFTPADSITVAAVPELLATHLGRATGVHVIGSARVLDRVDHSDAPAVALAAAARRAGAHHVVEGAVYRLPDDRLRLDLRRVELDTGRVLCTWTVHGTDPFQLAHAATTSILPDLAREGCTAD